MPDKENVDQVATQGTQTTETAKSEINIEAITEKVKADLEAKYKNEISGLNRKVGETEKQLKERLTVEEQQKMQSEAERKEWLEDIAKTKADVLSLDEKHSALIKGNSKDEINASAELVKSFKDSITKEYEKQIKTLTEELAIYKANGTPPKKGDETAAAKLEFSREELKDPVNRKLYNETKGAYIKNE